MSEFIKVSSKLAARINARAKQLDITPAQYIKNTLDDQDEVDGWSDANTGFTNEGFNGPRRGDGFGPAPSCCAPPCNELVHYGVRFIKITARYDFPCPHCARKIPLGSEVYWSPGYAAYHVDCLLRCAAPPVPLSSIRCYNTFKRCGWRY